MPTRPPTRGRPHLLRRPCNDICPVLAAEIEQADTDLGVDAADVEFVTVNTDPSALAQSARRPALDGTGLGALPNWHMVTGPLASLEPGMAVLRRVDLGGTKTGLEAHTDVHGFHRRPGRSCVYGATPFADESATGTFSLSPRRASRAGPRASPPTPSKLVEQ